MFNNIPQNNDAHYIPLKQQNKETKQIEPAEKPATRKNLLDKIISKLSTSKTSSIQVILSLKERVFRPQHKGDRTSRIFESTVYPHTSKEKKTHKDYIPLDVIETTERLTRSHHESKMNGNTLYQQIPQHERTEPDYVPLKSLRETDVTLNKSNYSPIHHNQPTVSAEQPAHEMPPLVKATSFVFSFEALRKTETIFGKVLNEANKVGGGIGKTVHRVDLEKRQFKEIKSAIQTSKANLLDKINHTEKKLSSTFDQVIHTIQSAWTGALPKNSLEKSFDEAYEAYLAEDPTKMQTFANSMEKIAERLRPKLGNDPDLQTRYMMLHHFFKDHSPLARNDMISLKQLDISSGFFQEIKDLLNESKYNVAVFVPRKSDPQQMETVVNQDIIENQAYQELQKADFVRTNLRKINTPFKEFVSVPYTIETPEGHKRLVDRLFNLDDLGHLTAHKTLSVEEKHVAAIHAAKGLAALHQAKIIHGDFAARNILARHKIDKNGQYKLKFSVTDFGMSIKEGEKWQADKAPLRWASPELLRNEALTTKTDICSFGVVLLELMEPNGRFLNILNDPVNFHMNRIMESSKNYIEFKLNNYLTANALVLDPDVKNLLLKCFEPLPENRPNAEEIVKTLEKLQKEGKFIEFQSARL